MFSKQSCSNNTPPAKNIKHTVSEIVNALNLLDVPVIMGSVLVIAFMFILINIIVDIIYIKLDPRIKIN